MSAHQALSRLGRNDQRKRLVQRPGGQGVAGSNPAVPTRTCRSEGVSGVSWDSFWIFGSQPGSTHGGICGGFAGQADLARFFSLRILSMAVAPLVSAGLISCR